MRIPIIVLSICFCLSLAATAFAVSGGKVIEFNKSQIGRAHV